MSTQNPSVFIQSTRPESFKDSLCVLVLLLLLFVFVVCFPSCDTREKIAPCEVVLEITVGAVSGFLGAGLTWRDEIAAESGRGFWQL